MKRTGNTILITGGGSGIGRGLAEAFHELGNQVIIAGRRQKALEQVTSAHPGMKWAVVDVQDAQALEAFAHSMVETYPTLNVLINNAAITSMERLASSAGQTATAEAIISTNILAPLRLTTALLPHLQAQVEATIINVGSGLAHVPLAAFPTYSASMAFIHSYTQSLRYQLERSAVRVLEIIPPAVQTALGGNDTSIPSPPGVMPLDDFIVQTMELLLSDPTPSELCVDKVKPLRFAETNGNHETLLRTLGAMIPFDYRIAGSVYGIRSARPFSMRARRISRTKASGATRNERKPAARWQLHLARNHTVPAVLRLRGDAARRSACLGTTR